MWVVKNCQCTVTVTQATDSQNINYTDNIYSAVTITPAGVCSVERGPLLISFAGTSINSLLHWSYLEYQ